MYHCIYHDPIQRSRIIACMYWQSREFSLNLGLWIGFWTTELCTSLFSSLIRLDFFDQKDSSMKEREL